MEELPTKLKLELALIMINRMYANITFFRNKEKSFIAWIARLIRPINVDHEDYIYKEGEEIAESKKFVLTLYSLLHKQGPSQLRAAPFQQQDLPSHPVG